MSESISNVFLVRASCSVFLSSTLDSSSDPRIATFWGGGVETPHAFSRGCRQYVYCTLHGVIMEADGMVPWMTILLYKPVMPSTSMIIPMRPTECLYIYTYIYSMFVCTAHIYSARVLQTRDS